MQNGITLNLVVLKRILQRLVRLLAGAGFIKRMVEWLAETGQTLEMGDGISLKVLETIEGYTVLRTDVNGWIELITDGEQLWVEVAR